MYIAYTDGVYDDDGSLNACCVAIDTEDDTRLVRDIETDTEWEVMEQILSVMREVSGDL